MPAHTGQETALDQKRYLIFGLAAVVLGLLTTVAGFMFAHFAGSELTDELGREVFPFWPEGLRGWAPELAGQVVSLGGALLAMAGVTLAFLYDRPVTWARAALGGLLFTGLMIILFGIVPNQWLNLAQGPLEWTSAKTAIRAIGAPGDGLPLFPQWLMLNNNVSVSYEAVKDIVLQGYIITVTVGTIVGMYQWQEWQKRRAAGPPPQPVSVYGRPVTKIGRN